MNTDDRELLQRYTRHADEAAFAELVGRYINLVYSAAARQTGNHEAARDVTQEVFSSLARKCRRLQPDVILSGWLHQATRFAALRIQRDTRRRQQREQEAANMDANSDPDRWAEMAPLLDELVNDLDQEDRSAVLLRFFESRPLADVGLALGITEDAARKRVSRAVDKLRAHFEKRGIAVTSTGLAAVLLANSSEAAPAALTAAVATTATSGSAGLLAWLTLPKLVAGVAVAAIATFLVVHSNTPRASDAASVSNALAKAQSAQPTAAVESATPALEASEVSKSATANVSPQPSEQSVADLTLALVSKTTDEPVADAKLDYWSWGANGYFKRQTLQSDSRGICPVDLPDGVTHIYLITQKEGLADTKLEWYPERGEKIPPSYHLALEEAVPIGGTVVDADGNPVAGAKVGFNNEQKPPLISTPESHQFGWVEVSTDAQGRWRIDRFADDIIGEIYGSAKHPDHVGTPLLFTSKDRKAEEAMRKENYAFHLGRAVFARGKVIDRFGLPLPYANILVGRIGESGRREGVASADGSFSIKGCRPGKNLVTASRSGYAAQTIQAELGTNFKPVVLTLSTAKTLRLRVVDNKGNPITGANVWLNTFAAPTGNPFADSAIQVQTEFEPVTGADGRVTWDEAPDKEMHFDFAKHGFMRLEDVKLRPTDDEQVITLQPAVTVTGTVADAATGKAIPRFRVVTGWPDAVLPGGQQTYSWSTIDRFTLNFSNGVFKHTYDEPVISGIENPRYVLKFKAEGYAPCVSRIFKPDEGEVKLDIRMKAARAVTLTILSPDDLPVAGVEYLKLRVRSHPGLNNRRIAPEYGSNLERADAAGQIKFMPDPEITGIMIANEKGFRILKSSDLTTDESVRLQPWGSISGTLVDDHGQPLSNIDLDLQWTGATRFPSPLGMVTKTAADGHFSFDGVPPGQLTVAQKVTLQMEGSHLSGWSYVPLGKVTVEPGQTVKTSLAKSASQPQFMKAAAASPAPGSVSQQ